MADAPFDARSSENADGFLVNGLRLVLELGEPVPSVRDPLSVGSAFGQRSRPSREVLAVNLGLRDPRQRLIMNPLRGVDSAFALASAVTAVTGNESLDFITTFNPRGRDFSDDGKTLPNSHGARLINGVPGGQLQAAVKTLKSDESSRRAVVSVHNAADLLGQSRDVPCVVALHFMVRQGELRCVTFMRSQSALMVLPYDLYAFTFLQEVVASELELKLGPYWHMASSFHLYDDDLDLAREIVLAHDPAQSRLVVGSMPPGGAFDDVRRTEDAYRALAERNLGPDSLSASDVAKFGLPAYWTSALATLVVGASRAQGFDQAALVGMIDRAHLQRLRPPRIG